uniref:Microsomal triglyceride transfer protein large subunit n=1 Tax=Aceria tosichella TaxID=561515 RepID=A0A6G1S7F0_9ACAR
MLSINKAILAKQGTQALVKPITLVSLCCVALVYAASFSSGVYNEYVYNYEVQVASGPNGFRFKAKASLDVLYAAKAIDAIQDNNEIGSHQQHTNEETSYTDSLLVRLKLTEPMFYTGAGDDTPTPLIIDSRYNKLYNPDHNLYAHIVTLSNGTAIVKEIYTHQSDATTFKNIKKSILLNLLPTNHHLLSPSQQQQLEYISIKPIQSPSSSSTSSCIHDNNEEQPELFSPDSISQVEIIAKARKPSPAESTTASNAINKQINLPTVFQTVNGQQNVTFRSRVFAQAESNLTTKFSLELVNQIKSNAHEKFDQADSMASAIKLLDERQKYQLDSTELERERKICSTHHCDLTLAETFQNYRESLTDESMASVEAAVAFLRLLERLRSSKGTSVSDIMAVLRKSRGNQGVESSFLDVLAAARTKDSISAALKHIKLPKNHNLDIAERFLSVLSVACKTASKMHLRRPLKSPYYFTPTKPLGRDRAAKQQQARMASLEYIAGEFLNMFEQVPSNKWASIKLRQSSLLTLSTLVNANNHEHNYENVNDAMNLKVEQLLFDELKACDHSDTDCRVVAMNAIGNVGRLTEAQFSVLKDQVLQFGRRESNAAMKVLRDLLQNQAKDKPLDVEFYKNLKDFLLRIVYDHSQETTSRVLAAEMIVRFVPNFLASVELLNHLPSFGNNELATMIYSRMQSLRPDDLAKHHENWYWKSCIINGTSTSFIKTMARTDSLNASYGVNVELLNRGKVFKESSFDVFLDTKQRTQDLFSLNIFARGLAKFASGDSGGESSGGSDESSSGPSDDDEATMAGMSLRLLGGYLRPYVFFTGMGELMSHIWHQTASKPTTAFNGNLLLMDHQEGYPLISGFVAEQQMRGVLSIDVSGWITVSWFWKKNSHSVVTTKAAINVQASQSVFTSYDNLWDSHLFSFGGQALIDFVADAHFTPMPVRTCLQVTQPEFMVRYNSRRHKQTMTNEVSRKMTRRNYYIGAKSYSLNSENNKMCSALIDEL